MTEVELHWLAGLLEGEGSFLHGPPSKPNCPAIVLHMTDLDVVERAAALMGTTSIVRPKARATHHKPSYLVKVTNRKAIELMKRLKPILGDRRRKRIEDIVARYNIDGQVDRVRKIRKLSDDAVRDCRRRHSQGESYNTLAAKYKVARTAIVYAVKRVTYKNVV